MNNLYAEMFHVRRDAKDRIVIECDPKVLDEVIIILHNLVDLSRAVRGKARHDMAERRVAA